MRTALPYILLVVTLQPASASVEKHPKNGVMIIGEALTLTIDDQDQNSLIHKCQNENRGTRFFSNSCTKLMASLQKKMSMMALESDLQMQAERLKVATPAEKRNERIAMLAKLNLLSQQAEDSIKSLLGNTSSSYNQEHLLEVLPTILKVQTSYLAYLKLIPNGKK